MAGFDGDSATRIGSVVASVGGMVLAALAYVSRRGNDKDVADLQRASLQQSSASEERDRLDKGVWEIIKDLRESAKNMAERVQTLEAGRETLNLTIEVLRKENIELLGQIAQGRVATTGLTVQNTTLQHELEELQAENAVLRERVRHLEQPWGRDVAGAGDGDGDA